ncbi:hypothetical protein H2204_007656 [Knufia peltigerae]|uniref:Fungal-specific transcription factor domain-containing protein n=1 Tax=Knufia peltigerae TaxID=1002370 RepID=A0AA38Y1Q3_9EURO|nr:hypothetical protein H2204_007656 [Knufia peltigerae]
MSEAGRQGKTFAFIDSSKVDRLSQRLVRSHAMKGKNAGKRHHRRSRLDLNRHQLIAKTLSYNSGSVTLNHWPAPSHSVSFPIKTTLQSRDTINKFFAYVTEALLPPQICCSLDKVTSFWWRFLFADQTAHHCTLALLATLNDFFFGSIIVSHEALYHLTRAVSLVNEDLKTTKALSSSTLTVVNFLVVHEIVRESKIEAEIHLEGLRKMVSLRGGLANLEASEDALLVLKFCRTDLDCALSYGTTPCFYRDRMSDVVWYLAAQGFPISQPSIDSNPWFNELSITLQQLVIEVTCIGHSFNMGYKLDPYMFQEFIVSLGYRLVRFHPIGGPEPQLENKVDRACHIGLIVFLTTLFLRRGDRCFMRYEPVAQQLKSVIETGLEAGYSDLTLWLLFIGGVSVLGNLDSAWLKMRIVQAARLLKVTSWKDAQSCLVRFPWINLLHNEAGEAFWKQQEEFP